MVLPPIRFVSICGQQHSNNCSGSEGTARNSQCAVVCCYRGRIMNLLFSTVHSWHLWSIQAQVSSEYVQQYIAIIASVWEWTQVLWMFHSSSSSRSSLVFWCTACFTSCLTTNKQTNKQTKNSCMCLHSLLLCRHERTALMCESYTVCVLAVSVGDSTQ